MALDLRSIIADDMAIKSGGFTGAIFLTYSLNLTFFEQILAPALDQAGCANILILADPDGYQQALETGVKSISGAGVRYVCAPIEKKHRGVQHAKMLFMAGKDRGHLLIGSGNLTFHGYGRNLELYSHFEYNSKKSSLNDSYPFIQAWELLQRLAANKQISVAAQQQLQALRDGVPWVKVAPPTPSNFRVWHNYERPIWEQLMDWRKARGLNSSSLAVKVISPYYDRKLEALKRLVNDLNPVNFDLHLDPSLTNMNGGMIVDCWGEEKPKLSAFGIGPSELSSHTRHVHAKAIVGIEKNGAWCITGSANLSKPALLNSWQKKGNLELVTFSWENDIHTFDYLFQNEEIKTWSINLSQIAVSEEETVDYVAHNCPKITLADLSARGKYIEGRLTEKLPLAKKCYLSFQRHDFEIPLRFKNDLFFDGVLPVPLKGADMAKLGTEGFETPFRWIDQPDSLAQYASRTYHARIKGRLETLLGAEKMFQELMKFLLDRVATNNQVEDKNPRKLRKRRAESLYKSKLKAEDISPPDPDKFITEEVLVRAVQRGIESHQPYDRSLLSLRDLLSRVLLRLTTPTQTITEDGDDTPLNGNETQPYQEEQKAQQIKILDRLGSFLKSYCKQYGRNLTDEGFIRSSSPDVIFQNHATLARVLLEFAHKAEQSFTQKDFVECFWWIWAPLTWPEIVGLQAPSTFQLLENHFSKSQILQSWNASNIAEVIVVLHSDALGQPPSWEAGIRNEKIVKTFMVARECLDRTKKIVGPDAFSLDANNVFEVYGIFNVGDLFFTSIPDSTIVKRTKDIFSKIENYRPPAEEKLASLIELQDIEKNDFQNTAQMQKLMQKLESEGLQEIYGEYCRRRAAPLIPVSLDSEDTIYCRCGNGLTLVSQNTLKEGNIVLCDSCRKVWLYLIPSLPQNIWAALDL